MMQYNAVCEDWAKRPYNWFKDLTEHEQEGVLDTLEDYGIGRVVRFDDLPGAQKPSNLDLQDELTLWVTPMGENYCGRGQDPGTDAYDEFEVSKTKSLMRTSMLKRDGWTDEPVHYYRDKNLIVCLFNPFSYEEAYELLLQRLDNENVEEVDAQQIRIENWCENARSGVKTRLESAQSNVESKRSDADYHREHLDRVLQELREERERVEDLRERLHMFQDHAVNALEELRDMDIVERVELTGRGMLELELVGEPYLETDIIVDKEVVNGVEQPISETWGMHFPVYYELDDNIHVRSDHDEYDLDYPHPHVRDDGYPCFGDANIDIKDKYKGLELKELAKKLYAWERSYNKGDCYKTLQRYFDSLIGRGNYDND